MITIAPATFPRMSRRAITYRPIALADAPSATKTMVKPRMNASDATSTCRRAPAGGATATATPLPVTVVPPRMSSSESPDRYDR